MHHHGNYRHVLAVSFGLVALEGIVETGVLLARNLLEAFLLYRPVSLVDLLEKIVRAATLEASPATFIAAISGRHFFVPATPRVNVARGVQVLQVTHQEFVYNSITIQQRFNND